jgi:hypothetical protein
VTSKTVWFIVAGGMMKQICKAIWNKVRNNPVIIAFLTAVATQVFQDWQTNRIDWTHFWGYLVMVFIAVATRELVVPNRKHEQVKAQVSEAIVRLQTDRFKATRRAKSEGDSID